MNLERVENLYAGLIAEIEHPVREELQKTPRRAAKALREMLDGYEVDVPSLFTSFDGGNEEADQIVSMKDIEAWSVCEHHLIPFHCKVDIAYLPNGKVIGASKLERLVCAYAHRLQLQERIANQVASALMKHLQPRGVAIIIEGEHGCMRCRGVKSRSSKLVNSVMIGEFRGNSGMKAEVLALLGLQK